MVLLLEASFVNTEAFLECDLCFFLPTQKEVCHGRLKKVR